MNDLTMFLTEIFQMLQVNISNSYAVEQFLTAWQFEIVRQFVDVLNRKIDL